MVVQTETPSLTVVDRAGAAVVADAELLESVVASEAVVVAVKVIVLVCSNQTMATVRRKLERLRPLIGFGHSPCSCNLACRRAAEVVADGASEIGCRCTSCAEE